MDKTCRVCNVSKPLDGFYIRGNGHPRSLCRSCFNAERTMRRTNAWSAAEDQAIRDHYPSGGPLSCGLEGRTKMSIMQRAHKIGVNRDGFGDRYKNRPRFSSIPADDRPDSDKALDYVLRDFRECEPAANLTWIIGAVA